MQRKTFSADFKVKVALEAIRGVATTSEIASRHKVHPNQITKWKKQAQENLATLFADGRAKMNKVEDDRLSTSLEEGDHLSLGQRIEFANDYRPWDSY
jgi:transposase-like protein